MVPAGNKAKRLLSVNHTTKTIHHYCQITAIFLYVTMTYKFSWCEEYKIKTCFSAHRKSITAETLLGKNLVLFASMKAL